MTERIAPVLSRDELAAAPAPADAFALAELTHRWWAIAVAWATTIALLASAFARVWSTRWAVQWGIVSGLIALYVLLAVRRQLPHNRREAGTPLLANFGPGNALSLQRGLATVMIGGFLFAPRPPGAWAWAPVALYTVAAVADLFDGYLARRADHTTELGVWLDMEFDSLGIVLVTLLAVGYGQLPAWYLPIAVGRPLFVWAARRREHRGLAVHPLPDSAHRRLFAGVQMGFLSAALWPIIPADVVTLVGVVVAVPTVVGFVRDWMIASGRLRAADPGYRHLQRQVVFGARVVLPLLLRPMMSLGFVLCLRDHAAPFGAWPIWLGLLLALAVLIGFAGRLSALLFLVPLGAVILADGVTWPAATALVAAVSIILVGTGPVSTWRPEERYLFARPGTQGFGEA